MIIVQPATCDQISYDPSSATPIVVEVHEMVVARDTWSLQHNSVIATPAMIVVDRI
jgi:hypothetical protein